MNKNGVTLVELLAVIAIIGILAIMVTPGFIALRNSVLQDSLENKISQIENAAKDYGYDHINDLKIPESDYNGEKTISNSCELVMVKTLISGGYISEKNAYNQKGEDVEYENQIVNPVTGENMNFKLICVRFDKKNPMTRQVIAYMIED